MVSTRKLGCTGLVVAVAGLVLWAAYLFGGALLNARSQQIGTATLGHELPRAADGAAPGTTGAGATPPPILVALDFTVGNFRVVPGKAGEPIRVAGKFDSRSYVLEESFEPAAGSGGTYRVRFREKGWLRDQGLRTLVGGAYPSVAVFLPPDVPIALEGRFSKGGTKLQLGGLWLTSVDIQVEKGGFSVRVDHPTVAPLESLRIRHRQGSFSGHFLGNASPRTLTIDASMGYLSANLNGAWTRNADVSIGHSLGPGRIILPDGVRIEGLPGDEATVVQPGGEVPPPTLHIDLRDRFSSLEVRR